MLSDEELRDRVQAIITPLPSPHTQPKQKWRRPAAILTELAPLFVDHRGETADCIFGQVETGNLYAPVPGTLDLHESTHDWNPFFGIGDNPSLALRKIVARRLEACVSQPVLPYEFRHVGRAVGAPVVKVQRSLKLPDDQAALTLLLECCRKWEAAGERAAFAPFLLRYQFSDPDCREIFDDILDYCGVALDQREQFFADHATDPDAAFDNFVTMGFSLPHGSKRWLIFRGLPKKDREALEGRQRELIEIERRRAGVGIPPKRSSEGSR